MNVKKIDCTGFHFHCPDDRAYVIFNPQSQEENDRLDALFGATPLWKESLEKKRAKFQRLKPNRNLPVHGWRFELTAQDVIEYCEECTEAYFRHKSGKKEQLVKRALMRFLRELHCR
jgi:hypothetical protein